MEWVTNIINGSNGKFVIIFISIVVLFAIIGIKKGFINLNIKGIKIGARETELKVLRVQMQTMNTRLDATIKQIPPHLREGLHYYRAKYIISKVKDIFEETLVYNHITDDDLYINLKQELVYNTVLKLTDDEFFTKENFKEYLYKLVEDLIKQFVRIRRQYE